MPIALTNENFKTTIEQSKNPVIIDAYAVWCGPCQQMTPIFHELEKEFGNQYTFAKLNVDDAREVSIQLGVTSVPTFIFYKDGKIVGKHTGSMSKDDMLDLIEDMFS